MDSLEFETIEGLHNDKWPEILLTYFQPTQKILTKKERVILGLKVQFYEDGVSEETANKEIAKVLGLKITTIIRAIYDIKYKYRQGMDRRIDNKLHPEIYRRKMRKERRGYSR